MLFTRSFFTISCIIFSVVKAAPIQSDTSYTSLGHISDANFLLTESLSEYYENIVDQAMLDVSENVLTYIPESISHGNVEARQLAQKSIDRNLNFMRASLLASIHPLVSTDIPQIRGFSSIQDESARLALTTEEIDSILLDSILQLNKKMSHQLGLIVNADKSSSILMKQANNHPIQQQQDDDESTIITVEWKLRKPFQINIIREQHVPAENDITMETNWLHQQLSSVETELLNEFNDRTEDAIQIVKESLELDIF